MLFELTCLQILAVHFAITQTLDDEPIKLEAVLTAYYEYWLTYSKALSVNYAEEIQRRLSRYREAVFAVEELGASLAIGDLFSELCGIDANFAAFGANVFVRVREAAGSVLRSLEIDLAAEAL